MIINIKPGRDLKKGEGFTTFFGMISGLYDLIQYINCCNYCVFTFVSEIYENY